jgi:two-component system cell cycle response regulator
MADSSRASALLAARNTKPLSPRQVVLRIALIISIAESAIMLALSRLEPSVGPLLFALQDGLLLILVSTGPIYLWVVRPFAQAHEDATRHIGYLAYHDPLTDLPNRRMLFEHLEHRLAACERHKNYGALLLLDLDGFKEINDTRGHDVGDLLLQTIAQRLEQSRRQEDIAGRLGGDEFIVLAQQLASNQELAEEKAFRIARKLQESLIEPIIYDGIKLQIGCSIGIRLMEPQRISTAQAIREADIAMYRAKRVRNNGVQIFTPTQPVPSADSIPIQARAMSGL